jgi:hypothetical protein
MYTGCRQLTWKAREKCTPRHAIEIFLRHLENLGGKNHAMGMQPFKIYLAQSRIGRFGNITYARIRGLQYFVSIFIWRPIADNLDCLFKVAKRGAYTVYTTTMSIWRGYWCGKGGGELVS